MDCAWRLARSRLRQVQLVLMRPLAQRQPAQGARQSFATALSSRHWAKALRVSERENILKLLKKKRYALAFRSE